MWGGESGRGDAGSISYRIPEILYEDRHAAEDLQCLQIFGFEVGRGSH